MAGWYNVVHLKLFKKKNVLSLEGRQGLLLQFRSYKVDCTLFGNKVFINPIAKEIECIIYFSGIQQDITKRKSAEQEIFTWSKYLMNCSTKFNFLCGNATFHQCRSGTWKHSGYVLSKCKTISPPDLKPNLPMPALCWLRHCSAVLILESVSRPTTVERTNRPIPLKYLYKSLQWVANSQLLPSFLMILTEKIIQKSLKIPLNSVPNS